MVRRWAVAVVAVCLAVGSVPPVDPAGPVAVSPVPVVAGWVWGGDDLPAGAPAAGRLRRLAAGIARAPADTTLGGYGYVRMTEWQWFHRPDGSLWRRETYHIERWRALDGSCRGVEHVPGTRRFLAWRSCWPGGDPPAEGPAFIAWLYEGGSVGHYRQEAIDQLVSCAAFWPLRRAQRAAGLLDLAEKVPQLRWRGRVTDRIGRTGVALTVQSWAEYTMVIVSPSTGELLAVATRREPDWSTRPTVSYLLFVGRHFTWQMPPPSPPDEPWY